MKWYESGVEEVADEVFRVPLPLPEGLPAVNAYVLREGHEATVIDPGWDDAPSRSALEDAARRLATPLANIRRSLVTHLHRDHVGGALALRHDFAVPVVLGAAERPGLEWATDTHWDTPEPQIRQMLRYGGRELAEKLSADGRDTSIGPDAWGAADHWLDDRERCSFGRHELVALHTPGHTRGHTVFLDARERFLFTGDHLLPTITPSIGFDALPSDSPLVEFLRSLDRLTELPVLPYLPAHGAPGTDQHARVAELREHHVRRRDLMLARLGRDPHSAADVAEGIGWTKREQPLHDLDRFNQVLAVIETDAHLMWAVDSGLADAVEGDDGVRRYRACPTASTATA